ncbi:MAG: UDP-N-acetylmuramoyl-tripeptide--D-alanyl-D-alanine ligase [Candidatus Portnoybacteria bacterium]|jgi:UDP-N-acetylmuramoyl-tripeptide--D-alanyl-D-alanine ligase|nr:UDP-N-acetylmuramoyl-tripeptide--D-alanyl-D-alanine ligase [Candidatus Portnoybacteria bacterium]
MVKKILCFLLRLLAELTLWRYRPQIIGVTGSVGKTSTKEAIYTVLRTKYEVRRNRKNYNNEIGVPLTILGQETGGKSPWLWAKSLLVGFFGILYARKYPEILVLEMGADRWGDIAYLTSFVKCHVAVITSIGEIPVHVENFQNPAQVVREKAGLVRGLGRNDWAILNFDDPRVKSMAERTRAQIFYYGFAEEADLRVTHLEQHLADLAEASLAFKVDYQGSNVPVKVNNLLGRHQVYPLLAAIATGLIFKINLVDIADALQEYRPVAGRCRLLPGLKSSWIIDDTYNASPSSTLAALEILKQIAGRKIAVLGDMLELGAFTEEAHRKVGLAAAQTVDRLLAVGEKSIFIIDEALKNGLPKERVEHFASSEEAGRFLQETIAQGDVILVKGSQGKRMEKVVKDVMAEPEKAKQWLVRQDEAWLKK